MIQETNVRSAQEIQKAHDILVAVNLGEIPLNLSEEFKAAVLVANDVLCWVLHHDNENFNNNLELLDEMIAAAGYIARPIGGSDD